jgi:hypothetical protein
MTLVSEACDRHRASWLSAMSASQHVYSRQRITDRNSKYSVSGSPCRSANKVRAFRVNSKRNKVFAVATRNSWGLICGEPMIKNDDDEASARLVSIRMGGCCWTPSVSGSAGGSWRLLDLS